jgi:hypothetical protein
MRIGGRSISTGMTFDPFGAKNDAPGPTGDFSGSLLPTRKRKINDESALLAPDRPRRRILFFPGESDLIFVPVECSFYR